jgi:hypothetical protein
MHNYKVSRNALIFRLKNLNQISNGQMQHYLSSKHFKPIEALKKLEKLGMKSDEVKHYELSSAIGKWPEAKRKKRKRIDAKAILSSEYKSMVLAAYERGLITYRKVADYLFLDVDELKKIVAEKEVTYEI